MGTIDSANLQLAYDFSRCQRPDGSHYGTSGQCRKGTEVKMPKSPGIGTLSPSELKGTLEEAKKEYGGEDKSKVEDLFNKYYSKAEHTKHLGAIHRAVKKAMDEDLIPYNLGAALAIKKALSGFMQANDRSGVGAKREKELEAMTPEERERARFRDRVEAGIRNKVVKSR